MKVIIIGAGLAGLTAANYLKKGGCQVEIIEATDRVGGRIKTDRVDGYLLDHGFQVFLTTYPEAKALLNYEALDLKKFVPGASILRTDGKIKTIGDPQRDFSLLLPTLSSGIGNMKDKFSTLSLKYRLNKTSLNNIFTSEEKDTKSALKEYGFSTSMIRDFFMPFYRGIFLEEGLDTSRRMFDFVFKMFSEGHAAIPANGMEAIPQQLVNNLLENSIHLNQEVVSIDNNTVQTAAGQTFQGDKIIIATEANKLITNYKSDVNKNFNSVTCVYFTANQAPLSQAIIALNPIPKKLVNNLCVLSNVSKNYAPSGKHLIACSVGGYQGMSDQDLSNNILTEMRRWFGNQVQDWKHLKTYRIKYALPDQTSVRNNISKKELKIGDHLYVAGDHLMNGSINAAMKSGRLVAEAILEDMEFKN